MSAADRRAELEAVIWRERGGGPRRPAADIDAILAAADLYADATAAEAIAANVDIKAIGGQRLTEAGNEIAKGIKYTRRGPDAQERKH